MPRSETEPPPRICVIDTQIIIAVKNRLRVAEQWPVLRYLDWLVDEGWITFPKQVAGELEVAKHPDGPGIWAVDARRRRHYAEPSDDSMADVLGVAPGLFDPNEERNQADPYVVALAYELQERWPDREVCVATENTLDRGGLISPGTACQLLGIKRLDFLQFFEWLPLDAAADKELIAGVVMNLWNAMQKDAEED